MPSLNKKWIWVVFLPILFYPVFITLMAMGDFLLGEGRLAYHGIYGSRKALLSSLLQDWMQSLPSAYAMGIICCSLFLINKARKTPKPIKPWLFLCFGGLIGAVYGIICSSNLVLGAIWAVAFMAVAHLIGIMIPQKYSKF